MATLLHAWLRNGVAELPSGGELPLAVREEVLRRLDDRPQHRRRWLGRWLDGLRGATRDAPDRGSDTTRRNRLMFATTAAVSVATLALAASLIVPGLSGPGPAPAAPAASAAPAAPAPSAPPTTSTARADGSTLVTGSVLYSGVPGDRPDITFSEDGTVGESWVGHGRGMVTDVGFEWSDPRLPMEVTIVGNFEAYGDPREGDVGAVAVSNMWLVEGPDGYWTGPYAGWCDAQDHCRGTVTLTGHGAYEGFYAVLTEQPQADSNGTLKQTFEGAILAGEMPPIPESMGPTAQ
jgi:hypothetical protein